MIMTNNPIVRIVYLFFLKIEGRLKNKCNID